MSHSILGTIVEEKQREITALPQRALTVAELEALSHTDGGRRDFLGALRVAKSASPAPRVALIAEIKKASPSAGVIRADFDPVRLARDYEAAGATCLSVLTDRKFFQGSLAFLKEIRQAVRLPLLRKDFIIDERQIAESLAWGADAILLIVAILSDEQLTRFQALAAAAHLTALVEVHDEPELERAVACGARLIGVNNRDLKTFKVDLGTTERLAARLFRNGTSAGREGADRLLVAESGIHTSGDVARVARAGADAILVGESLMRERELGPKVRELLGLS